MRSGGKRLALFASFEFDLGSLELRKGGVRLRLERKPAKALVCLLEHHGELVERGDLVVLLWPGESHGNFDHRLNKAINKLRLVLGDDFEDPRFIRTHSGSGYCFVAEVRIFEPDLVNTPGLDTPERPSQLSSPANPGPDYGASIPDVPVLNEDTALSFANETGSGISAQQRVRGERETRTIAFDLQTLSSWARRPHTLSSGALILMLGLSLLALPMRRGGRKSSQPETRKSIAVFGFTNLSGNPTDAWLDAALTEWITTDLADGGQILMVPSKDVARIRGESTLHGSDNLNSGTLAKLRNNLGSDFVISGSYASIGVGDVSTLRLDLQIQDAKTAEILHTINIIGGKSDICALASNAGAQLRRTLKLGTLAPEGLETAREMLPHNAEAERFYTEGIAHLEKSDAVDARAVLDQAIAIEPRYALSHSALSEAYSELGYSAKARDEATKAFSLSGGLPAAQKLLVEGQFRETCFDWDKAIGVYRSLVVLFPENVEYALRLARVETSAGKAALAFETLRRLRQFTLPVSADAQVDIAEAEAAASVSDFHSQQESAARAAVSARQSQDDLLTARAEMIEGEAQRALANFPEALRLWTDAGNRFTSLGDHSAMARILVDEGKVRWQQGDLARAESSYEQAIATGREIGDEAELARAFAGLGQIKMYEVSSEQGRKLCDEALAIFRKIGNQEEQAYVLSLIADTLAWRHAEAKPLYEQSLELSRKVNDRSRTAGRLMDLGIIATVQGDLVTAEQDLQESLRIYHETGERNREALQMSRLAIVFKWEGRLNDAEKLSKKAIEILQSGEETSVRGQVRQNLALIQLEAGKLTEAQESMRLAMEEHRQANDLGSLGLANINLAEILAAEGKWTESRIALGEVGKLAHWNLMPGEHVTAATLTRARLYASERQFGRALREAERGCDEARRMDQGSLYMKAELVRGEIELQSGRQESGHRHLEELVHAAEARRFGLIADQARKVLDTQSLRVTAGNAPIS